MHHTTHAEVDKTTFINFCDKANAEGRSGLCTVTSKILTAEPVCRICMLQAVPVYANS